MTDNSVQIYRQEFSLCIYIRAHFPFQTRLHYLTSQALECTAKPGLPLTTQQVRCQHQLMAQQRQHICTVQKSSHCWHTSCPSGHHFSPFTITAHYFLFSPVLLKSWSDWIPKTEVKNIWFIFCTVKLTDSNSIARSKAFGISARCLTKGNSLINHKNIHRE